MIEEERSYRLSFSGNAPYLFPTEIVHGVVSINKDYKKDIKKSILFKVSGDMLCQLIAHLTELLVAF